MRHESGLWEKSGKEVAERSKAHAPGGVGETIWVL